ncbi:MAG: hypothetical protein AUK54_03830 [Helicobacteraceae bacterium CG2_30_36_10]|nr:MAG: hypothetical protein AUK54_03830 [Helicobacteraceae bacterium CG2_30_36_10]
MKTFYYVHTGHRIGLDRFRRAATIIRSLGDVDITLLCSDFRIAQVAKDFGVQKSVGLDVIRNIPQIAHNGDQLIFDSEEANPIMLDDMRKYFSTFIRVSDSPDDKKEENELLISPYLEGEGICKAYAVDDSFFTQTPKTIKMTYFFGDDDYEKDLEKNLAFLEGLEPDLQLGFYYFLDYEENLKKLFKNYHEFEEYEDTIKKTEILITASPQAVLESLACGSKPIYIQREDYTTDFIPLFESLNIPIIKKFDKNHLNVILETINNRNYYQMEQKSNNLSKFIKENLTL